MKTALTGKLVYLRPVETSDLDNLVAWRNESTNWLSFFNHRLLSAAGQANWLDSLQRNQHKAFFIVCEIKSDRPIGTICLDEINFIDGNAEYGSIVIGDSQDKGKGFAKDASIVILDYGFKELNLHRIFLRVFASNDTALGLYRSLGFKDEGIMRDAVYRSGKHQDIRLMSILRHEWA